MLTPVWVELTDKDKASLWYPHYHTVQEKIHGDPYGLIFRECCHEEEWIHGWHRHINGVPAKLLAHGLTPEETTRLVLEHNQGLGKGIELAPWMRFDEGHANKCVHHPCKHGWHVNWEIR